MRFERFPGPSAVAVVGLTLAFGVLACDGDDDDDDTMQPNQLPTVTVTAPGDGSTFEEGAEITFTGTAEDPEDGALSGASLVWSSDLDGQIGTGGSVTTGTLSVGTHTVTLTATDSDGGSAAADIQVTVESAPVSGMVDITIRDNEFVDLEGRTNEDFFLRVTAGTTIRWTYDEAGVETHTVTSGEGVGGGDGDGIPEGGTAFDSGTLNPGESFEVTLDVVGMYTYFCQVHPDIMFDARIEVVEP